MTDEPRETELKFRLDPARAEAVFAALVEGPVSVKPLTAIYYDTPRRTLAKAGLSLRVRHDGKRFVQTLKSAAAADGALGRGEWEARVAGAAPDRARLRGTPAWTVLAKAKALAPLFTVKVERRTGLARAGETVIELALDRGEIAAGGRCAPVCELEMELKAGDPAELIAFAARARAAHGLALSFATKAARGDRLLKASGARASRFVAPALSPQMPTGGAFKAIARAALEQLVGNAERLKAAPSPEVIHQMRVAARRLRSALSTFKAVVRDRRVTAVKAELKWLTGELDTARNLDVLLAGAYRRAARRKADLTGLVDLGRRLRQARTAAYARARSAAESERFAELAMATLAWIECGPWTRAPNKARDKPVRAFAAKALARRWGKVVKVGKGLEDLSRVDRHHLRIDAKKLRYAAEVFAGLSAHPRRAAKFVDALRGLQDCLGELNDIATGEGVAHDIVASPTIGAEADWAAGRLIGEEAGREAALLETAKGCVKALKNAKPFWTVT